MFIEDVNHLILIILGATFVGLLGVGSLCDLLKYKIPNEISVGILGVFTMAAFFAPEGNALFFHLVSGATVFLGGLAFWKIGVFGAGDIKFAAAIGTWAGWDNLPSFLLISAMAGGVIALILILVRWGVSVFATKLTLSRPKALDKKIFQRGSPVPYGLALASGAFVSGLQHSFLLYAF